MQSGDIDYVHKCQSVRTKPTVPYLVHFGVYIMVYIIKIGFNVYSWNVMSFKNQYFEG